MGCYYCGRAADGSPDHVPPEVLYASNHWKRATPEHLATAVNLPGSLSDPGEIVAVPSCLLHNEGASGEDEAAAVHIVNAGKNGAAMATKHAWLLRKAIRESRGDLVGEPTGIRRLADDDPEVEALWRVYAGEDPATLAPLPPPTIDGAALQAFLERNCGLVERTVKKIAAGLFYAATQQALGEKRIDALVVASPSFKCWSKLRGVDASDYFSRFSVSKPIEKWDSIVSGHHDVFSCRHTWTRKKGGPFAMEMRVFGDLRLWVVSR